MAAIGALTLPTWCSCQGTTHNVGNTVTFLQGGNATCHSSSATVVPGPHQRITTVCAVEELLHEAGIAELSLHTGSHIVFARLMRDEDFSSSLDEPSQFRTIDLAHTETKCLSISHIFFAAPTWQMLGSKRNPPRLSEHACRPGPGRGRAGLGPAVGRRRRASSD